MTPCIAIIDRNTLSGIALRSILWETFGNVEIHLYTTMDRFIADSNRHFIHFFVDSDILFRYIDEFVTLKSQTTVLHEGTGSKFIKEGFNVLDLSLGEGELKNRILQMQLVSRYEQEIDEGRRRNAGNDLSPREQEVLEYRYGLKGDHPCTLEEVGKKMNVTRERIRQIEAKALRKLKEKNRPMREYLD